MKLPYETDEGIGSRATVGLIVLQSDETFENEVARLLPRDGVALHHTRIAMPPEVTVTTLASMEAELPRAAAMLPAIDFDVIGYGCTSGATVIGPPGVAAAIRSVHPGAQVTEPISAVIAACRALGAQRLGFVTPYVPDVSAAMRAFLEAHGLTIAGFGSFEQSDDRVVARMSPRSTLQAIETVAAAADCDAVFVSCTNLRVAEIAAEAERRIGKPVVSSNLALAWHVQVLAGITPTASECGRLFDPAVADRFAAGAVAGT